MCEYCEKKHEFKDWDFDKGEFAVTDILTKAICSYDDECKNASEIWIEGNKICADNSGREYVKVSAKINYCPMCGRKL